MLKINNVITSINIIIDNLEKAGFEPATLCLQNIHSTIELYSLTSMINFFLYILK